MKKTSRLQYTVAALLVASSFANAAVTSFSVSDISDANLATLLTPDAAYTETVVAWGATSPETTIGGITYSGGATAPAGITLDGIPFNSALSAGTADNYTAGDNAALMGDQLYSDTTLGASSITFSNLTIGQQYQLLLTSHQDIGNAALRTHQLYYSSDAGLGTAVGPVQFYGDNTGVVTSVFFTADEETAKFSANRTTANTRAVINSVALATIPEPSSLILVALGGVTALALRRRK